MKNHFDKVKKTCRQDPASYAILESDTLLVQGISFLVTICESRLSPLNIRYMVNVYQNSSTPKLERFFQEKNQSVDYYQKLISALIEQDLH